MELEPVTYLPQCGRHTYADFNPQAAKKFDLTDSEYYQTIVPDVAIGITLGVFGVLGFVTFTAWLCVLGCGGCLCLGRGRRGDGGDDAAASKQFLEDGAGMGGSSGDVPVPAPRTRWWRQRGMLVLLLLEVLAAACIVVGAWGIAASVQATDNEASNGWKVVGAVQDQVGNASATMASLADNLFTLAEDLDTLNQQSAGVSAALIRLGVPEATVQELVLSAGSGASTRVDSLGQQVERGFEAYNASVVGPINELRAKYEPRTLRAQESWRFIPIAVCFGLLILASVLVALLGWRMRHPRLIAASVASLWLAVALLMFLGVGLLGPVQTVTGDACLYVESFVQLMAATKIRSTTGRQLVSNALAYYFGAVDIPPDQLMLSITGVNTTYLLQAMSQFKPEAYGALAASGFPLAAVGAGLSPAQVAQVTQLAMLVPMVTNSTARLDDLLSKASMEPRYHDFKRYICCELDTSAANIWVAWTAAGSLGLALALVASTRVIRHTLHPPPEEMENSAPQARVTSSSSSKRTRFGMRSSRSKEQQMERAPTPVTRGPDDPAPAT